MRNYLTYTCIVFLSCCILFLTGCNSQPEKSLPVLGQASKDFNLTNQDNQVVTKKLFHNKVVVTDFFFTTCPSICPIMKRQMHRVYIEFQNHPGVLFFSHTIDPEHDTVDILRDYATGLGIKTEKWQLVTGEQDDIFALAKHYMLGAMKDDKAPGGYLHSGSFVLLDTEQNIRGYYNGTDETEVDELISDLKALLKND